ncbi:hypothetical protein [Nocardia sp. IFM 10818]
MTSEVGAQAPTADPREFLAEHAFTHLSIEVPSLLFVTTRMVSTAVWTMMVYRSNAVRLDDDLFQPVADLYDSAEPSIVEEVEDESMMFGAGIRTVHFFRVPGYE